MAKSRLKMLRALPTFVCCIAAAHALLASDGEAERIRRGGKSLVSNWHVGPFFEYRRVEPGGATF